MSVAIPIGWLEELELGRYLVPRNRPSSDENGKREEAGAAKVQA